jgi:hypothetical protein
VPGLVVFGGGWIGVAGVGDEVGARPEVFESGSGAVPAEHEHGGRVGADQEERVEVGQGGVVLLQLLEGLLSVGGREQRELAS